MKKNIFDLEHKEGLELDSKMLRTSYFKQYNMSYLISSVLFAILSVGTLLFAWNNEIMSPDGVVISIILISGFVAIMMMMFNFKRFDLIKTFYEDTKNKK